MVRIFRNNANVRDLKKVMQKQGGNLEGIPRKRTHISVVNVRVLQNWRRGRRGGKETQNIRVR